VKILKNRHMVTATLVAPLLALMSYYAVDHFVGETPHAAEAGMSYQLVEKPNCRYESGSCGLKNGDFELTMVPVREENGRLSLTLRSEFPLNGVVIARMVNGTEEQLPRDMRPASQDGRIWKADLAYADPGTDRLRLVASAGESFWFGDAALKFALELPDQR